MSFNEILFIIITLAEKKTLIKLKCVPKMSSK